MLKITLITMGNKMPAWVDAAVQEFKTRLQEHVMLTLIEIPLMSRGKSSQLSRILEKEMLMMKQHIPSQTYLIALNIGGQSFSSPQLAVKLKQLQHTTSHICFIIGGPEGLPSPLVAQSQEEWSLSSLTLPHTLARIVLLETLYRAFAIINNHPYHK